MPIKLIPPTHSPFYYGRGTYLGVFVNQSTKATRPGIAKRVVKKWEGEIERGVFDTTPGETFMSAAVAYIEAGGERRPMAKLIAHFGAAPLQPTNLTRNVTLKQHWQKQIDSAAATLFPTQSASTRNRECYTPVSSVLKHAGLEFGIRRPKGWRGKRRTGWLWPEWAFQILQAARQVDLEFGIYCEYLCYAGPRLTESLTLACDDLRLQESFAWIRDTKNGDPRPLHLPSHLVVALANHPRGLNRPSERVFRFKKGGLLYDLLEAACMIASGLPKPKRVKFGKKANHPPYRFDWVTFHTFCHTYGTWMKRYGGLDDDGLVDTGRWKSREAAAGYSHTVVSEAARKADLLPTPSSYDPTTDETARKFAERIAAHPAQSESR